MVVWSVYNTYRRLYKRPTDSLYTGHMKLQDNQSWKLNLVDKDTRNAVLEKMQPYQHFTPEVIKIKHSGKTHVANYTKYRYNGSSKRDVEVWHSPTNIWINYYLMFSTPFEDSCIRYNGEDVTGYNNTSTTQQEASESTFSHSQYVGNIDNNSRHTVRSRSYYDDSYSSSSSSDSYGDSGSSSSSSSSCD